MNARDTAAALGRLRHDRWISSAEGGLHGTTVEALERRGLVESRWVVNPYRRIAGRLTGAGVAFLIDWHKRELDRLYGIAASLVTHTDDLAGASIAPCARPAADPDVLVVDGILRAASLGPVTPGSVKDALTALDRIEERLS